MPVNMGSVVAYLELDTSKFSSGFAKARNDLKVFKDQSATATQKINGLSSAMIAVGGSLTKGVTVPLAAVGVTAVNTAVDFEKGMSQVRALSGTTGSDFEALRQKAIEMGAETKFSATEAADAFTYMAQAGWKTDDMLSGIEGTMSLAAASGEDLATATSIVTSSLTAFGLGAEEAGRFSDVLARAAADTNTNVSEMGDAFKYVAPVAGALGYSIEDTSVALGLMANQGIIASQAGTSLRSLFTNLTRPVGQAEKAINALGISIKNTDGTVKPLSQTLEELRQKFSGLSEAEQAQYAAMLAGQEGMSGLLAIVNASDSDFQKLTSSINNASGSAEDMADVMMDNTAGAVEQLSGALESAGIIIGEELTPYIRRLAEWITNLVDNFNDLSEEQQQNIVKWALLAAGMGPVLMTGGKLLPMFTKLGGGLVSTVKGVTNFTKALTLMNAGQTVAATQVSGLFKGVTSLSGALTALANPVGIAVTAIGAMTAGLLIADQVDQQRIKTLSQLTGEEGELAKTIDEQSESYRQMKESRDSSLNSIDLEFGKTQALANELKSIVDENGRVIEGNETRAQIITGMLSDAMGQEISITDGVIDNYRELRAQIDETIQKQKAMAIQEAMSEGYAQAIRDRADAQRSYNEALKTQQKYQTEITTIQAEMNSKQDEWAEAAKKGGKYAAEAANEQAQLNEELEIAKGKYANATTAVNKAEEAYVGYNETIQNYEGLTAALVSGSADEISLALTKIEQGFVTASGSTVAALQEQRDAIEQNYNEMKEQLEAGNENVTQQMVDNLKTLLDQADAELQKGIEQQGSNLVQSFSALGIELTDGMIGALEQSTPEIQQSIMLFMDNLNNGVSLKKEELITLFTALGMEAPQSLVTQLSLSSPQVQAQAIALLTELQTAETAKRPEILRQLNDLGIKIDDNLAGGIEANKGKVEKAGGSVGSAGNKKIQENVKKDVNAPKIKEITNARSVASSARGGIQSYFNNHPVTIPVKAAITGGLKGIGSMISGSHARGLDYVPYNGYIAELHEGERVLTKQQNREYNEGRSRQGGDTFNFYNTQPTPYEYARQMKKAKKELLYGI